MPRKLSTRGALLRGTGISCLAGLVLLALPNVGKTGDGGYVFSNVEISAARPPAVLVTFDVRRDSPSSPGMRLCTWTARDGDGRVVGESTRRFILTGPSKEGADVWLAVTAEPESVEVKCDTGVADAHGTYVFSQVGVEATDNEFASQHDLLLTMTPVWRGDGMPDTRSCTASFRSATGDHLFDHAFRLTALTPGVSLEMGVTPPDGKRHTVPVSASIECPPPAGS